MLKYFRQAILSNQQPATSNERLLTVTADGYLCNVRQAITMKAYYSSMHSRRAHVTADGYVCNVRQAIKMNPNYVPALLEYARFQLAKKDLKMADYYFQHTLKKDPSNGEAMLAYAQFLRQHRKDAPGALALYRKAAELYII